MRSEILQAIPLAAGETGTSAQTHTHTCTMLHPIFLSSFLKELFYFLLMLYLAYPLCSEVFSRKFHPTPAFLRSKLDF